MNGEENKPNIDVGIITIKQEEFSAVVRRLDKIGKSNELVKPKHSYIHQSIATPNGYQYNVAVARCLEQGTGKAQSLAADMVDEIKPAWIFLVGIAGGVPAPEYSLGDVMLCTRLHDFSRSSVSEGDLPKFAPSGGPMHFSVEKLLEVMPAHGDYLETCGWNSRETLSVDRPRIDLTHLSSFLIGDDHTWKENVIDSLTRNFSEPRKPRYYLGPIGSSDNLVKSPAFLKRWLDSVRDLTHIDMELAGVYHVAQKGYTPLLSIRGLSDIVGFKRSHEWTQFACESAASFSICLIQSGIIPPSCLSPNNLLQFSAARMPDATPAIHSDKIFLLSDESPFNTYGSVPLGHRSYIERDSDIQIKTLLKSQSFICVQGDFGSGKSSLLIRVPPMLLDDWKVVQLKVGFYKTISKHTFMKAFFADLQKVDAEMQDWFSVGEFLKGAKIVFLIDEIGGCPKQAASMLIKNLYDIIEENAAFNHARVVVTMRDEIRKYIIELELTNPKYRDCWKTVMLSTLTETELVKVFNLFPPIVALLLRENLIYIQKLTSMKPKAVQELCHGLWNRLRGKKILIKEIDLQIQGYLKDCKKL
jgi:nucleoside phosphorylase